MLLYEYMTENKYIKNIKFKPFLRRSLSPLATSVVILGYTEELKKAINFSFKNICYLGDGNITESLRTKEELKKYSNIVKKIVRYNRTKCNALLNKGLKQNDIVNKLLQKRKNYTNYSNKKLGEEFSKLLNVYTGLFLFSTILPFEVGSAFNNLTGKKNIKSYLNLENKINRLRINSFYSVFEEKIIGQLFKEVAKRRSIKNYKLLFNLEYQKMLKFILEKIDITEVNLQTRTKYINLVTPKIKFIKFGESNYQKYYKLLLLSEREIKSKTISGSIAYPGKAKGKIRILINRKDITKFIKGEILVTISSNPELLPAIKKARAIIADEGGIACHASIISRELKIPCIVGTKNATRILQNGDLVEVDANNGTINILKRV